MRNIFKTFNYILLSLLAILSALFFYDRVILSPHSIDEIKSGFYKSTNQFPQKDNNNEYISSLFYEKIDDNNYEVFINFKSPLKNIIEINLGNVSYEVNKAGKIYYSFYLNIPDFNKPSTSFNLSKITTSEQSYSTTYLFDIYKNLDKNIINDKLNSVVGVSTSNSWGSGIILSKTESIEKDLFRRERKVYNYIIITAEHVIEDSTKIRIHYKNTYNTFNNVKLLKSYPNYDLSILELITYDGSLKPLNDSQFESLELKEPSVGDQVFLIGSPAPGGPIDFNNVKVGQIEAVNHIVDLNGKYFNAIKYDAVLGKGSSGGALFNEDGYLIGLHFAGTDNHTFGFSIPLNSIIDYINEYLDNKKASILQDAFFILFITY